MFHFFDNGNFATRLGLQPCKLYLFAILKTSSVSDIRKWYDYDTHNLQSTIIKSNERSNYAAKNLFLFFIITAENREIERVIFK